MTDVVIERLSGAAPGFVIEPEDNPSNKRIVKAQDRALNISVKITDNATPLEQMLSPTDISIKDYYVWYSSKYIQDQNELFKKY